MKKLYGALCIIGTLLPISQLVLWVCEYGINVPLLFNEIASSRLSLFAWLDVIVSAVVLVMLVCHEAKRLNDGRLYWSLAGLMVGVSLALPLFLYLRENSLEQQRHGIQ